MSLRCARHGLRVAPDGRCLLCREPPRARRGRAIVNSLFVCAGAALALLVGRPPEESPGRTPAPSVAQAPRERPSAVLFPQYADVPRAHEESADEPAAEDALLGPSLLGELAPLVEVRVPEPPRAYVEPEPTLPDDPRDFTLH